MSTEITTATNVALHIFNDPSIGDTYTSFNPADMEGKVKLYSAINSPDHKLADFINKQITVKDVVVCKVVLSGRRGDALKDSPFKEEDSKDRDGFRIILVDVNGETYTATSAGIYNSVKLLRSIFGDLHFEDGLAVTVLQLKTKNGNTLTLSLK